MAVKFSVEDLLPRAEIQFPLRDRYHYFATHDLSFQVRISVILSCPVVVILCEVGA